MPKGQQRSNKEKRKPKQNKDKKPATAAASTPAGFYQRLDREKSDRGDKGGDKR